MPLKTNPKSSAQSYRNGFNPKALGSGLMVLPSQSSFVCLDAHEITSIDYSRFYEARKNQKHYYIHISMTEGYCDISKPEKIELDTFRRIIHHMYLRARAGDYAHFMDYNADGKLKEEYQNMRHRDIEKTAFGMHQGDLERQAKKQTPARQMDF